MKRPLERLKKLTLALEASIIANDWGSFNALLAERESELASLTPGIYAEAGDILKLDARLQATMGERMNQLRARMNVTAHAKRTARAVQANQSQRSRLDFAG